MTLREELRILVDFDGCLVTHEFPRIGERVPFARKVLRELVEAGHKIILWTCRSNSLNGQPTTHLDDAVRLVRDEWGIPLHAVNANGPGDEFSGHPKAYGDVYIDDKGLGTPTLRHRNTGVPFVNWYEVRRLLAGDRILPPMPHGWWTSP